MLIYFKAWDIGEKNLMKNKKIGDNYKFFLSKLFFHKSSIFSSFCKYNKIV